jgi:beta-N-acetylhexosaminidase
LSELDVLAHGVLLPGFAGTRDLPDWLPARLERGLGGVVLFARNCIDDEQVARLVSLLRAHRPDLLVAIDEEGGDVTRLDAARGSPYPGALVLGVADDVDATAATAESIAVRLDGLGIDWNFAPVADVNTNPRNPVIGVRSFGADPALVARHVGAFVTGTQGAGIVSCVKHFPGHGDTAQDSHLDLPVVSADLATLRESALVPFRAAVDAGARSVMTAHLLVPALDPDLPSTLSAAAVHGLLREELGFSGAVVSDALEMAGVAATFGVARAAVMALSAGCDVLCLGGEADMEPLVEAASSAIVAAVRSGELSQTRLREAVARVESMRAWRAGARRPKTPRARSRASTERLDRAARAAVRIDGDPRLAPGPVLLVELVPVPTIAVGDTTWGIAEPLRRARPDTVTIRLDAEQARAPDVVQALDALAAAGGRAVVLVVRDAARHPWQDAVLDRLVAAFPTAVVVEVGLPGPSASHGRRPQGWIWTHGAGRVSASAAVDVLVAGEAS